MSGPIAIARDIAICIVAEVSTKILLRLLHTVHAWLVLSYKDGGADTRVYVFQSWVIDFNDVSVQIEVQIEVQIVHNDRILAS